MFLRISTMGSTGNFSHEIDRLKDTLSSTAPIKTDNNIGRRIITIYNKKKCPVCGYNHR